MAVFLRSILAPAVAAALVLSAAGAGAADPPTKAGKAAKPSKAASAPATKSALLTPDQLRECMAQKERLHTQADDALKDKAAVEAEKAEIARSGTDLEAELAALDKTSPEAVEAYNAKAGRRDQMIDGYEAKVSAYNAKAETVKSTKEGYERSCENRRYDERDLTPAKRKK